MNAANSHRASYFDLGGLPGPNTRRQSATVTVQRRRTFVAVDYAEYRAKCDLVRDSRSSSGVYDIKWEKEQEQDQRGSFDFREQLRVMATVYPYRDANWIIAVFFVVGSISFTINGFFGLLPLVAPSTAFPTEATLAAPVTNAIGAALFVSAGILSLPAIWNTGNGTLEPVSSSSSSYSKFEGDEEQAKTYQPALLGSPSWVWLPSRSTLKDALKTTPFQSGAMQLFAGSVLTTSVVFGFPGVLAPDDLFGLSAFVFTPLLIGGGIFTISNIMLLLFVQERWYKPRFGTAAWQASLWNVIASTLFAITGVLFLSGDTLEGSVASFIGSWAFLIGSVIQWYDMMAFYCGRV
ncbi:hypothetical protein J7T55_009684 [Diaporthe amygdali]|uniref:uncharacterized protein n=1 Tax=Phomopsis amygdali TaxID=1214568 RepID=UPI0022FF3CF0|nr:uncharacterized protein J7T55_009684 [Diaporthe amygdali]KAJ0104020.1 hypothetical protein J7T55_009684 [Diaporthe amygdali]